MSTLWLKQAELQDAQTVARLAITTFVDKFGHLYDPNDLREYLHLAYGDDAIRDTLTKAGNTTWLLMSGDEAVGFALTGEAGLPHNGIMPGDGEIKRFYVDPQKTGAGLGAALMEHVLKQNPNRTLWLGVFSENDGAQRFYSRYGFEHVGEYEFPVGQTRDREFIFRRPAPII